MDKKAKGKIYIFNNGGSPGLLSAQALSEDGVFLAGHCCSEPYFMPHDMGIGSDWKHDTYNAYYPDGWELVLVEQGIKIKGSPMEHEGLKAAYEKHKAHDPDEYKAKVDAVKAKLEGAKT